MSGPMQSANYAAKGLQGSRASEGMPPPTGVTIEKVANGFAITPHPHYERDVGRIFVALDLEQAIAVARRQLIEV